MTQREQLRALARAQEIDIYETPMKKAEALAAQVGDTCAIALDPAMLRSQADETVKLAHELGHCMRGAFYTELCPLETRARHEHRANVWAARRLIPWPQLRAAVAAGLTAPWELAEHFGVTESFLNWTIAYYTGQKGYRFTTEP